MGIDRRYLLHFLRRVRRPIAILLGVYVAGSIGFYLLQPGQTLFSSFYWGIVTLSTTGYGDIVPTNPASRTLVMGLLFVQLILVVYLVGALGAIVTEESQQRLLGTFGSDLRGHTVVLGYSAVGRSAVRELLAAERRVAVVTERQDEIANIRTLAPEERLYITHGPPAEKQVLERTNLAFAQSVIVCTSDDTTNLIASLNIRSLAPKIRIVVSVNRPELKDTLRAAGVTYVASPADMGGRLCADAAFRPEVANAVEDLTTASYGADIQEYLVVPGSPLADKGLAEAEQLVRRASGCLILGISRRDGPAEYNTTINPPLEGTVFRVGDAALFVGSLVNLERLHKWIGVDQGR